MSHPASPPPAQRLPRRGGVETLHLFQDPDGFLQVALVKLELLFERDPGALKGLRDQERMLEDLESLDFAPPPVFRPSWPRRVDPGTVLGHAVELAPEDLSLRDRGHRPFTPRSSGAWRCQPGPAGLPGRAG